MFQIKMNISFQQLAAMFGSPTLGKMPSEAGIWLAAIDQERKEHFSIP